MAPWAPWSRPPASGSRISAANADHPVDLQGDNEMLVLTRPDVIEKIHDAFLAAGADIIETDTFGSTRIAQADYRMEDVVTEQNVEAARIAKRAAAAWTARTPDKPRFVAGAIGPAHPLPLSYIRARYEACRSRNKSASSHKIFVHYPSRDCTTHRERV